MNNDEKSRKKPLVLTIAGLDPSSGAGITADIRTLENIGVYGMAVCTATTVQTAEKVYNWKEIDNEIVREQLEKLLSEYEIAFVKTGMLATEKMISLVVEMKEKHNFKLVVDPVIYSGSGARLANEDYEILLKKTLIPIADVITPNRFEAQQFSGLEITDALSVQPVCEALAELGCKSVIVKGGHIDEDGANVVDYLYTDGYFRFYPRERINNIKSDHVHGTGCVFSSLITGFLALGYEIEESIFFTEDFMESAFRKTIPFKQGRVLDVGYQNEELDVLLAVQKVVDFITMEPEFSKFVPEVRTNISIAKADAKDINEVAAVEGRITVVNGKPTASGPIKFAASNHTGRLVLSAQKLDPNVNAVMNIKYSPETILKISEGGLLALEVNRSNQTDSIKYKENSTMEWIIQFAYDEINKIPDVIWDAGEPEKEPMIRLFARDADDLIKKIKIFLNFA